MFQRCQSQSFSWAYHSCNLHVELTSCGINFPITFSAARAYQFYSDTLKQLSFHTIRPMSYLQFSRARKLQVWHRESQDCLTVAQLYFRIELSWQNAERWLVSCHHCFCFVSVRCCLIYFNLFNLFNLEMESLDGREDTAAHWIIRKEALFMRCSVRLDNRSICNFIVRLCCTLASQNWARKLQTCYYYVSDVDSAFFFEFMERIYDTVCLFLRCMLCLVYSM